MVQDKIWVGNVFLATSVQLTFAEAGDMIPKYNHTDSPLATVNGTFKKAQPAKHRSFLATLSAEYQGLWFKSQVTLLVNALTLQFHITSLCKLSLLICVLTGKIIITYFFSYKPCSVLPQY